MDICSLLLYFVVDLVLLYIAYKVFFKLLRIPQVSNLDSRYILITGCDTGFGNEISKRLDRMGCHVIAGCLTEAGETELRKACSNRLKTIHMDVSSKESVRKSYDEVKAILPPQQGLWGVLNNAGITGLTGPADWMGVDEYEKVLGVNLFGVIDVTMNFLPLIKKAKGRVVNTASLMGRIAAATGPYSVSKYGVEAFSDHLRRDMRVFGVSVSIIEPDFFATNICHPTTMCKLLEASYDALPKSLQEEYGRDFVTEAKSGIQEALAKMMNHDITPVLDAYTHALLGKYPRARYTVGKGIRMALFVQSLPEWLGDFILKGMSRAKAKPAACK